jgi:hypothetical protein
MTMPDPDSPKPFKLSINKLYLSLISCCFLVWLLSADWQQLLNGTAVAFITTRKPSNELLKYGYTLTGVQKESKITIVTAYYMLGTHSKHSSEDYAKWTANFFPKIQTPMAIFTSCDQLTTIKDYRKTLTGTIICYGLEDVPPLALFANDYKGRQFALDPENAYHYPELYFIWNAKPWYVAETAKWNPYSSEYFFWIDAGSFRPHGGYFEWPNIERVESIFANQQRELLLGMIRCPTTPRLQNYQLEHGPINEHIIQGGFFAATKSGALWFADTFYKYHNQFYDAGHFVGKEQEIMSAVAVLHQEELFMIDLRHVCMNYWFFSQPFFSSEVEMPHQCRNFTEWDTVTIESRCV